MGVFTTKDGTGIFYKDLGTGQPVLFSHGWPLSADAWDGQMMFLGERGYRVIAHDRRSHGRSSQTLYGNRMDRYAADLAELIEALDLTNVVLVGHSTGGGEIVRYVSRHGTSRVAKMALVSAVPPLMVKTEGNPVGCRSVYSMAFARAPSTTDPSFSRTSRSPSTATTVRAQN